MEAMSNIDHPAPDCLRKTGVVSRLRFSRFLLEARFASEQSGGGEAGRPATCWIRLLPRE